MLIHPTALESQSEQGPKEPREVREEYFLVLRISAEAAVFTTSWLVWRVEVANGIIVIPSGRFPSSRRVPGD